MKIIFLIVLLFCGSIAGTLSFGQTKYDHIGLANHQQDALTVGDIWHVLRRDMQKQHYALQPAVQHKLAWFQKNPSFLANAINRAAPYLYYIVQQVKARHLPIEYALVPIIESGFNPFSTSPMGAAGIWQLMPDTALGYGIKKDWAFDGRRDVILSTQAALNYFVYLHQYFGGNHLLALAAYNTGEGNLLKAIKRNLANGKPIDFWSLPISQETKDYVPSLLALAIIIAEPEKYGINLLSIPYAPYLTRITIKKEIDLQTAAGFAGVSLQKLNQLNPGFNLPTSNIKRDHQLILPASNILQFKENMAAADFNLAMHWFHYRVKRNEKLTDVAKKFAVPVAALRHLNQLQPEQQLAGATILVPQINHANLKLKNKIQQTKPAPAFTTVESNDEVYHLQPGDTVYMVRKNDSLKNIAEKFKVKEQAIIAANPNSVITQLKDGTQLIVPTHQKA